MLAFTARKNLFAYFLILRQTQYFHASAKVPLRHTVGGTGVWGGAGSVAGRIQKARRLILTPPAGAGTFLAHFAARRRKCIIFFLDGRREAEGRGEGAARLTHGE